MKKPTKPTTNQPTINYLLDFKLRKASLHQPCQTLPIWKPPDILSTVEAAPDGAESSLH